MEWGVDVSVRITILGQTATGVEPEKGDRATGEFVGTPGNTEGGRTTLFENDAGYFLQASLEEKAIPMRCPRHFIIVDETPLPSLLDDGPGGELELEREFQEAVDGAEVKVVGNGQADSSADCREGEPEKKPNIHNRHA